MPIVHKKIAENFYNWEFWSPDVPGADNMHTDFIQRLQNARTRAGIAFVINSGWRTPEHHGAIYRAHGISPPPDSAHLDGWAADIHTGTSYRAFVILKALIDEGFPRLIVYSNFIHADCHPDIARFPQPMLKPGTY